VKSLYFSNHKSKSAIIVQMVLALLTAGLVFCGSAAASFVFADSPRVKKMGRWVSAGNGSLYAGRGGVLVSAEFEGTGVQVQMFSDSQGEVWWLKKLDNGPLIRFKAQMGMNVLYQNLPYGKHTLIMIRDTEGMRGVTILRGFFFAGEAEPAVGTAPVSSAPVAGQGAAGKGSAAGQGNTSAQKGNVVSQRGNIAVQRGNAAASTRSAGKNTVSAPVLQRGNVTQRGNTAASTRSAGNNTGNAPVAQPVQRVPRRRCIEIIGDSVAAGAFIYPEGDYFQRESGYLAFGPQLARMLHADWSCVTSSGEGAVRNNEEKPPYTAKHADEQIERAFYTQKEPRWNNQMDDPELVILAYGENDFNDPVNRPSDAYFKEQYKKLVQKLRQFRPKSAIFCMTPANTVTSQRSTPGMGGAVAELRAAGDSKVYFINLNSQGPLLNQSDFLDGVHPLVSGHEKIALYLRTQARAILGWN